MDLTVADADATRDFYQQVTGWDAESVGMGGYTDYAMKPVGGDPVAGICHARGPNVGLPACWLMYITVADLDASMDRTRALGGQVVYGPRDMGGYGRMCVIRDNAGAAVGLIERKSV